MESIFIVLVQIINLGGDNGDVLWDLIFYSAFSDHGPGVDSEDMSQDLILWCCLSSFILVY